MDAPYSDARDETFHYVFEPRALTDVERTTVEDVLRDQLPSYELFEGEVSPGRSISIPYANISPPIQTLQDHFGQFSEFDPESPIFQTLEADSNLESAIDNRFFADEPSDVRVYSVKLRRPTDSSRPVPVVISLTERKILGFACT